jgi:predicted heme/steroid binding protein
MRRLIWSVVVVLALGGGQAWGEAVHTATESAGQPATIELIDLNQATVDQLESLPGVGAVTAARIVEYRQANGGFKKIEELMGACAIDCWWWERIPLQDRHLRTIGTWRRSQPPFLV